MRRITKEYFVEKLYDNTRPLAIGDGENTTLIRIVGGKIIKHTFLRGDINEMV